MYLNALEDYYRRKALIDKYTLEALKEKEYDAD